MLCLEVWGLDDCDESNPEWEYLEGITLGDINALSSTATSAADPIDVFLNLDVYKGILDIASLCEHPANITIETGEGRQPPSANEDSAYLLKMDAV